MTNFNYQNIPKELRNLKQWGLFHLKYIPEKDKNTKIPTIDIIPYYPDCSQSNFGPTWHTINDDMQHIDPNTLKAVGQTIIQVLYSEK